MTSLWRMLSENPRDPIVPTACLVHFWQHYRRAYHVVLARHLYRCPDEILGVRWPEPEADIDLVLDEPSMPPQEGAELQPMAPRRLGQD
ncbi:hypothetical protein N7451_002106 [Penicillium sp. IBT 35674x]|nr:hypothetical protein N7451_002106 [Penicillium sp. IBT 35674x]